MGESGSNDPNTYVLIVHKGAEIIFYHACPGKIAKMMIYSRGNYYDLKKGCSGAPDPNHMHQTTASRFFEVGPFK